MTLRDWFPQPTGVTGDLALTDADLERMSDLQLAELEDRLLLHDELDTSRGAQLSVGRAVVFFLGVVGWVACLALLSRLPTERLGPLNIPLYLGSMAVGFGGAHLLWARAGRPARSAVRWVLGHWPVALYMGAALSQLRAP